MVEHVWLSKLLRDGTQLRAGPVNGIDGAHVARIVSAINDNRVIPPVVAFRDGAGDSARLWLADGHHRVEAYRACGLSEIAAEIRPGTKRDAILYAADSRDAQGLERTEADRRNAVETLLRDEEWSQWSDREIARRVGVSDMLVASVKASLSSSGLKMPATRKVQRKGTTYTMDTANIGKKRAPKHEETSAATVPAEPAPAAAPALPPAPAPRSAGAKPQPVPAAASVTKAAGPVFAAASAPTGTREARDDNAVRAESIARLAKEFAMRVRELLSMMDAPASWGAPTRSALASAHATASAVLSELSSDRAVEASL